MHRKVQTIPYTRHVRWPGRLVLGTHRRVRGPYLGTAACQVLGSRAVPRPVPLGAAGKANVAPAAARSRAAARLVPAPPAAALPLLLLPLVRHTSGHRATQEERTCARPQVNRIINSTGHFICIVIDMA